MWILARGKDLPRALGVPVVLWQPRAAVYMREHHCGTFSFAALVLPNNVLDCRRAYACVCNLVLGAGRADGTEEQARAGGGAGQERHGRRALPARPAPSTRLQ